METTYRYDEIKKLFDNILNKYLENLSGYSYTAYEINKNEYVYSVEDSFIIYVKLQPNENGLDFIKRSEGFREEEPKLISLYYVVFEELTYNELFVFKPSKFIKQFKFDGYDFLIYKIFNGNIDFVDSDGRQYRNSNFHYVNEKLPQLQLLQRYQKWKGFLVNFIIYELIENGKKGYATCHTMTSLATKYAYQKEKDLEMCGMEVNYSFSNYKNSKIREHSYNGVRCDLAMSENMVSIIQKGKAENWKGLKENIQRFSFLAEKLTFFIVPIYVKLKENIWLTEKEVLKQAAEGRFADYEKTKFDISNYKWKSEELCYQHVKELYKRNKVIHQHRPYFLRTEIGQLSYDIFVCGKDIAIEYQGKQHFEPIELFGGKEHFETQQKRDEIKRKLSKENSIHLVYINYWEDITKELIKRKISEVLKNDSV